MDEQTTHKIKISSRGGARPGSGRPKGGTNKISGATILESIERYSGERFEDLLAQGYVDSIETQDKQTRLQYERMFLGKVVADKVSVDITEHEDIIAARRLAFQAALQDLTTRT